MLVAKATASHAEYYVGDWYTVNYVKNDADINIEKKKTGIASITIPTTFTTPNIKAVGTFSWGSVKDEFPVEGSGEHDIGEYLNYFYYNPDGHYFQHCECGEPPKGPHSQNCSMNKDGKNKREYKIIWRKN